MSDQFTQITSEGWGQRIAGSFVALIFGLLLLPAGIGLLYWNEGRAVVAASALRLGAASIVEASPVTIDAANDGKLVHLTAMMRAATPARDPLFGASAEGLLRLSRKVETYQWKENSSTQTQQSLGGTKTTETTYSYQQVWSSTPIDSTQFKHPEGHENRQPMLQSANFDGSGVTLGAYQVDPSLLAKVSAYTAFHPEGATPPADYRAEGDGFYSGQSMSQPAIGDSKVSFTAIPAQTISVAAALSAGTLTAYRAANGYSIALAEPGMVPAAALFQDAMKSAGRLTWILRGVGFLMLLIGLVCLTSPLTTLFAVVPFLESMAGAGAFIVAFTLAVPITFITIAVAWIAHRPLLGGALLVVALGSFVLLRSFHRRPA